MLAFHYDAHPLTLPPGHRFPQTKYRMLRAHFERQPGLLRMQPGPVATEGELALVHTPDYVDAVLMGRLSAAEQREMVVATQAVHRLQAEFENYKRRTENDYAAMVRYSSEEMITRLLPVLDDFERSMKAGKPADGAPEDGGFYRGVEMIYNKFRKLLDNHGVKEMEVLGKPFDPALHDALLQVPNSSVPPHTVLEVVDKGYLLHEKVIRHARVIVSADTTETPDAAGAN